MNNRNWIAVFLGLACLVLFVSVMGASGNWLNNNNTDNNGATPQQITQTVRGMNDNTAADPNAPTKIDANEVKDKITGNDEDGTGNNQTNRTTENQNAQDMQNLMLPNMGQ